MPDWKRLIQDRMASLHLAGAAEVSLVSELSQHLEDRYKDLIAAGASEAEAYRETLNEMEGAISPKIAPRMGAREEVQAGGARGGSVLEDLWKDLRYAARTMRKGPLFVLFVVGTLALGIGANTAIYTVVNTLVLNPLPVKEPGELAAVATAKSKATSKSGAPLPISYADLKDYQAKNGVFRSLSGYTSAQTVTRQIKGHSERAFAEMVTANYFSTLGLEPARGRFFLADEDSAPGAHPVAVMNYGTWMADFGAAPDIVGKTVTLNNTAFTVIGVAPPHFIGVNAIFGPDYWIPAAMAELLWPGEMRNELTDRGKRDFYGVGRLEPRTAIDQARANLATIASDLSRAYPATNQDRTVTVGPIRDALFASASSGASTIFFASAGLLLVAGIVLLIACSNVANLLLARAAGRQQEMAIRLAMGAGRVRLVRQLLTESMLLALLSGAAGLFIAYAGLRALFGAVPAAANFIAPKLDASVFLFALLVSLATGFLFGIVPALKASRSSVAETLKLESRTTGPGRSKITLANILLAGQVAFSFLLLVTAALFLRSIGRAYGLDPGFQTAHLGVFMTNPGQAGYSETRTKAFYKDARERIAEMPEVESVSWSSNIPLWARAEDGLEVEGRERRSQTDRITAIVNTVETGYFETAGVRIDSGREFTGQDRDNSTPVAIVNEKMAHDYWPNGNALGRRIQIPGEPAMRQVVGIARNANYTNWGEAPQPSVYVPLAQDYRDAMTLYVRSKGDPAGVLPPVERELRRAAPGILIDARTGREIIDGGLFQAKAGVALLSVFGLLALGLASIGLYGIMAYSVNQRRREIGLRMALGAPQTRVLRLILRQGMSLVAVGMAMGLAGALFVGSLVSRMLYGVSATDPASIAGAAAVLCLVALAACYFPARRASHVDPLVALREG